jgi:pantetheine-phosphate adenylyltransferase
MKVCIGGTFNIIHKGHEHLIKKAFNIIGKNGTVFIGVTTDEFLHHEKKSKPYKNRINTLKKYLKSKGFINRAIIMPISDKYGPTLIEDFDVIIVSPETYNNAVEINDKRIRKKPMKIIKIPYVLAKDGKIISTSRIIKKEIDKEGNLILKD